jgi:hypothetical protein
MVTSVLMNVIHAASALFGVTAILISFRVQAAPEDKVSLESITVGVVGSLSTVIFTSKTVPSAEVTVLAVLVPPSKEESVIVAVNFALR